MAVPSTTGSLKTKISDMAIGDYIDCRYRNTVSGTLTGLLIESLGSAISLGFSETLVTGQAVTNGFFYFIKVDKGLLIADRVVQHSVSWDVLNTGKVIQGMPWDNGNIIPTMTSNTAPSGVASASSEMGTSNNYYAWKAFDKDNTGLSRWLTLTGSVTGWLSYTFIDPKTITAYSVGKGVGNAGAEPRDWTFEGSNDGVNWFVLDNQLGQTGWVDSEKRRFLIVNNTPYKSYRINITNNNGNATNVQVGELEMFDTAGTIRSLTGGVAYADANGNSSTTDQGKGAFPTNNEWDKYIVNFPTDKIQAGKTLDDVFHWSGLNTWCSDTPIIAIVTNANRIIRGNSTAVRFNNTASNLAVSSCAFRPVLKYQE